MYYVHVPTAGFVVFKVDDKLAKNKDGAIEQVLSGRIIHDSSDYELDLDSNNFIVKYEED